MLGFAGIGEILGVGLEKNPGQQSVGDGRPGGAFRLIIIEVACCEYRHIQIAVPKIFDHALPRRRTFLR